MEWIKVLNKHILLEYNDLSDSEFRAWIRIMALCASLDHMPTESQMLTYAHYKTLQSLQKKLNDHSTDLQQVLNKVLIDVQDVIIRRNNWKMKKQELRDSRKNVLKDVPMDVSHIEGNKNKNKKYIKEKKDAVMFVLPEWIPKEPWNGFLEMRKEIKKPLNGRALTLAVNKLSELKKAGHDLGKVLDQSTFGKWQGLYALKEDHGRYSGSTRKAFESQGRSKEQPGTTYPAEYKSDPIPALSEEERLRNIERVKGIVSGIK